MSDELFPIDAVRMDSPKLAWIKKHGVITFHSMPGTDSALWFAGFKEWWPDAKDAEDFFFLETAHNGDSNMACADTEDEALAKLSRYYDVPLWNEEAET